MGNLSLALLEDTDERQVREYLTRAERACSRAKELTRQLLTFSRGGTPVKEALALPDLVRASAEFALTGSGVRPEITIEADLPAVEADAGQLNQVLHNLLINAVEAMPGGGTLTIHAGRADARHKEGLPLPAGEYALIAVSDRGVGIPKEHLSRIFDPYYTTKQKGSGLGLATCYSIVKGSTFRIFLPATLSPALQMPQASDGIVRGRGAVLVMDDEEYIRVLAGDMLSLLGYDPVFAEGATHSLPFCRPFGASCFLSRKPSTCARGYYLPPR
jgi:signal transduction histidine kinase